MPLYCDLVALNSSVSSGVTAPASLLQELQIKIRKQDVDCMHRHVPRSPQGDEAFAWSNIKLQKKRDYFCVSLLTTC